MWFWCQKHERVEAEGERCGALDRLGPYATREAAENWRETAAARNESWEEEDRRWVGGED
ncbi:MAG TPA: hypothetical protein VMM13_16745 [Euzebya sp.]|nr:hypothetical protein [Euzebya sp.]